MIRNEISRREFIKKGLQVGGVGLLASTLGCTGSLQDLFSNSAKEAILAANSSIYKVNMETGAVAMVADFMFYYGTTTTVFSLAIKDKNTVLALVLDNMATPTTSGLFSVNLDNGTIQTILNPMWYLATSIAIESDFSILIGETGNLHRLELAKLSDTTIATGLGAGAISGIAIENQYSAYVININTGELYWVNPSYYNTFFLIPITPAMSTPAKIAIDTTRNSLLISNNAGGGLAQIYRVNKSDYSRLSDLGNVAAGVHMSIALENNNSVLVGDKAPYNGLYRVDLDTGASSRVDNGTLTGFPIMDIAVRFI